MSFFDRFKKLTPERFARMFMERLLSLGDTRDWRYDGALNRLVLPPVDGKTPQDVVNLVNMYGDYEGTAKAGRDECLRRQSMAMMQRYIPETLAEARKDLLPVVRSGSERGQTALQLGEDIAKINLAVKAFVEDLEIGIAYDTEYSMARIANNTLEKWGISFEEALAIAIDNLRAKSLKPWKPLLDGVFVSDFGDYYDASRILLPDLLYRLPIAGNPVVMIPSRAVLLVTGDRNDVGMAFVAATADRVLQEPRNLSPLMLCHDNGSWNTHMPKSAEVTLSLLRVRTALGDYNSQQAMLKQQFERQGIDIFVASFQAFQQTDSGKAVCQCVWTEGVHSLLPKTDSIMLFRPSTKEKALLPWAKVAELCGHLMTPTSHLPVRYEVKAFPSLEIFAELVETANAASQVMK